MLRKSTVIHIMDASDRILFNREDADDIHAILEGSSLEQVNRCYASYLKEIVRQCRV
ncbi:MAG: hypothetical protein JXA07_15175 [Spirochaetes bacterium]|nr:hypothetical protein [Spirochaetota bacterium]